MNRYYILKRHDGTFYGTKDDRADGKNIGNCRMYSERDRLEFGKEWAPYFSFIEITYNDEGGYKFV